MDPSAHRDHTNPRNRGYGVPGSLPSRPGPGFGAAPGRMPAPATRLRSCFYTSRATAPLGAGALHAMLASARERNRHLGLSGVLVCAGDQYLQWLEGPEKAVAEVMGSIAADGRHADLVVHTDRSLRERVFSSWSMRLALPGQAAPAGPALTLGAVGAETWNAPEGDAEALVRRLTPLHGEEGNDVASRSEVVTPHGALRRWTGLLLHASTTVWDEAIEGVLEEGPTRVGIHGTLDGLHALERIVEAHRAHDACSELEATLAAGRLLGALRRVSTRWGGPWEEPTHRRALVAPLPGDTRFLRASLDAEALWQAGWEVSFPLAETDGALIRAIRDVRPHAIVLSLNGIGHRDRDVARARALVRAARTDPLPGRPAVVLDGQAFEDSLRSWEDTEADAIGRTPSALSSLLLRVLQA